MINAQLPAELQTFLDRYVEALHEQLPEAVHGVYLHGSISLGAFNPETSDLDFVTILNRKPTQADISALQVVHNQMNRESRFGRRMEGHYVPLDDMTVGVPEFLYPSFAEGRYEGLRSVMKLYWYQLRNAGVRIYGPAPSSVFPEVPWSKISAEMQTNLNHYWTEKAKNGIALLSEGPVEFAVLTICRILYTLDKHKITSKTSAGRYALENLPFEWHLLVKEALRIKSESKSSSLYPNRWQRAKDTQQFIAAMTDFCNKKYFGRG